MKIRLPHLSTALLAAAILHGCNGPTKAGTEARENARSRMDAFSAKFTYDQAMQQFSVGDFDKALDNVEAAIAAVPEAAPYELLRGRILLEQNHLERAMESFQLTIEREETYPDGHYFAGIVLQRWSDDEGALERYLRAFELEPDNVHYLLAVGESLIALGEFDAAREAVEPYLEYFEHNATLRQLLGQIALLSGDIEAGVDHYRSARLLAPGDVALREELAWMEYQAGQFAHSLATVKGVQQAGGQSRPDLMHLEAKCLTMLGRPGEAHGLYRQLTRNNPSDAALWTEFGSIAWELSDFKRVAQCGAQLVSLQPDGFEGYMFKALNERHHGRRDQAIALFNDAADRAGTLVLPHLLLGRTLEDAGRAREALSVYARALELDPESRETRVLYRALAESLNIAAVP